MKVVNNKAENVNIAYIGGGSRGWAWNLMSDLASEEQMSGTVRLYDIDPEAAKKNEIIGNIISAREDVKGDFHYEAVPTLKEALTDADFVVISILPGTFDEMESDVHLPEKYGIYQSVGDTVGPGGVVRAIRTLPMYIEITEAIRDYSPNAWVINYTNPMTLSVGIMYEIFPEIKAFGCCHEVFGTQELIADLVAEYKGIEGIKREEIKVNVQGINHFTWLNKATYNGEDIFPIYQEMVKKYYVTGYSKEKGEHWINDSFSSAERVKFDLFNRYGVIAAAGDRHLAEFCPPWYLKSPETVKEWKFGLTPVSWRREKLIKLRNKSDAYSSKKEEVELKISGEEGVMQMKALLGLYEFTTNVNMPNQGQIPNLPKKAIVETNALFSQNSVRPVFAGEIDASVTSLISPHVCNQRNILDAVMTNDIAKAFKAFVNDPLMTADLTSAKKLFNEMLDNTKKYLGYWESTHID